jgi:hypothetical protein
MAESQSQPDIVCEVTFVPSKEGGRKWPLPRAIHGCMFEVNKQCFECVLLLPTEKSGPVRPGDTVSIGIKFLWPEHVRGILHVGMRFGLREARKIACGTVLAVTWLDNQGKAQ